LYLTSLLVLVKAVTRVHRYTTQLKGPKEKTSEHLVMFALEKAAQRLNRKVRRRLKLMFDDGHMF